MNVLIIFSASEKEADEDEDEDEFPEIAPTKPSSEEVAIHTYIHTYIHRFRFHFVTTGGCVGRG